jgi:outer membrane murein-binding lipoprotein Lpp
MMRMTTAGVVLSAAVLVGCTDNASESSVDDLADRVAALEAQNAALQARVVTLETASADHAAKLAPVTIENAGDDFVFTGVNVYVQSGVGSTAAAVNGLGNLIVGYNEATGSQARTGSHNLIVGPEHEYTSYGGLVAGYENTVSGQYASVTGGERGIASERSSSVTGGYDNDATGWYSSVTGGQQNGAAGVASSAAGGLSNSAVGDHTAVGGGASNVASGWYSSAGGGFGGTASGDYASVAGGSGNVAGEDYSHVCGGLNNSTAATYEVVP